MQGAWRKSIYLLSQNKGLGYDLTASALELTITVDGLPPIKNEALSLLSVAHGHNKRVMSLLIAARRWPLAALQPDSGRN